MCQRCVKSQRFCHWMETAGKTWTVIHIENSYASGQRKRPRGPRSVSVVAPISDLETAPQLPLVDLKTQAMMYYMHHHLQTPKDALNVSKGLSDDFLPVWTSRLDSPILDLAVSSMALAVFSRTQRHPPAAKEASIKYHRLLQIAQATISSLDQDNVDACLLAIFFMSRYEDTVHRHSNVNLKAPFITRFQSFLHHDGALAILKIWKDRLSHSQPATNVIKHTRRGMIRSALLRKRALPEWILDGTAFGEYGLELEYDGILVRITNIRQRLSMLLKEKTSSQHTVHELSSAAKEFNEETQDIDKSLQDWAAHFPSSWCYQRHTLPEPHPWPMRDFYSPIVYSYSSLAYAAVWNQYYSTGMLISCTRLQILSLGHPIPDDLAHEQRLECLSRVETMANDLASTVPFCLQRFKVTDSPDSSFHRKLITLNTIEDIKPYMAMLVIWPLSIASSLGDVDVKQSWWFRSELARLGRITGAGVLECAETDRWAVL